MEWRKRQLTTDQFVKRIQNDVQDDVMCHAKLVLVSLELSYMHATGLK